MICITYQFLVFVIFVLKLVSKRPSKYRTLNDCSAVSLFSHKKIEIQNTEFNCLLPFVINTI